MSADPILVSESNTPERAGISTPKPATPHKTKQSHGAPNSSKKAKIKFEAYMPLELVTEGLKRKTLIKGPLRINPRNFEDAYVPHPDGVSDVYIKGLKRRNRALNDDVVVVQLIESEEKSGCVQQSENCTQEKAPSDHLEARYKMRLGKVVAIAEALHSRSCTGLLKPMKDENPNFLLFSPNDHRLPRIMVPHMDGPSDFKHRPDDYAQTLFIARITAWPENSQFAFGNVCRSLGEAGQIEPETDAMLNDYGIDQSEFSDEVLSCLPQELPWHIPKTELDSRRDLRKDIIFTIDPATARDLDDAVSCTDLGDGIYEIGVHIADVSYFVDEATPLDKVAASRATSVYLVQKVVPMLPRLLCEQLCSLNPMEDRLTFSVIWKMTVDGEIIDVWFGRSIIRSCAKLSYDHAQGFIDDPVREWMPDQLPPISDGVSISDIREKVLNLHKVAVNLRKSRADNGALRLDQVKLAYVLDKTSGLPCGCHVYQQRESNRLIEEFMLLANMSVANKIRRAFPEQALLRRHPAPQTKMLDELEETCKSMGIELDARSSGSLQASLAAFYGDDSDSLSRLQVLTVMCSRPMQLAKYFCTGSVLSKDDFWHYALSVPEYTHFTSPIRRYADVIVHRQLAAALGLTAAPQASSETIENLALHCNVKKMNAKRVGDMSSDLFFGVFVKECGPLEGEGMVMNVLDKSFDILILKFGVTKRVYVNKLPIADFTFEKKTSPRLLLMWKTNGSQVEQVIELFTKVHFFLEVPDQSLKCNTLIKPPSEAHEEMTS